MPKYQNKCPQHTEIDIYRGCSFNCIYCISHTEQQNYSFNLQDELSKVANNQANGNPYYLSPWTDAYQHCEAENGHTSQMVQALAAQNHPFFVITKSLLIKRDLAHFRNRRNAFIAVSLNTLSDEITALFEPDAPSATARKSMIEDLVADKSLKIVVKIDPIIPGITDGEELDALLDWIAIVQPEAVTAETLRLSLKLAEYIKGFIGNKLSNNILQHYPQLTHQVLHSHMDYRLNVLNTINERLKRAGVKASFCSASLPIKINEFDCRGGYNYDY